MSETLAELTLSLLRAVLHYDLDTGVFRWRVRAAANVKEGDIAGCINGTGYRYIVINGKMHRAHRLAWFWVKGKWPAGDIDHINGDKDDNRLVNLRVVTNSQNQKNAKINSRNTTGVAGVSLRSGKFIARITHEGRRVSLGSFGTLIEAAEARRDAELLYGYHENHGRIN